MSRKHIGILSMQKVPNYGSFLQAYGLKQMLLQMGADEVSFIDIEPGRILPGYGDKTASNRCVRLFKIIFSGRLLGKIKVNRFRQKLLRSIMSSMPILGLEPPATFPNTIIIGSDEVFNCCQSSSWGYTLQLYGKIPQASRIYSYAASFGHTTLPQLKALKIDTEISESLKSMNAISVRDSNSYDIIFALTGIKPYRHLDPVLIYGYEQEIKCSHVVSDIEKGEYILIYGYQGRITDHSIIKAVKTYARTNHKKIYSIYCTYEWCDKALIPDSPFDVLSWFKNADCIVTDTFHGTIFSIITHSRFCTLIQSTNRQKLTSLLSDLYLDEHAVASDSDILKMLSMQPDYEVVEQILEKERSRTFEYLQNIIDGF